jgi:hypothetical protein
MKFAIKKIIKKIFKTFLIDESLGEVLTKTSPREYKTNIKRQNIKLILL